MIGEARPLNALLETATYTDHGIFSCLSDVRFAFIVSLL